MTTICPCKTVEVRDGDFFCTRCGRRITNVARWVAGQILEGALARGRDESVSDVRRPVRPGQSG